MQHFELKGQVRQSEGKAAIKAIRKQGLVPCNFYGSNQTNILFTVSAKELASLTNTPASYIVDLALDGKKYTAVLHELQFHPVTDECLHVDFLAVDEKKPISINVPLVISGHAKGVQLGGKFYQSAREIRISAIMKNLPDNIQVDVTGIGLDKKIKAGDIKVENVTVLTNKDAIICGVNSTRNSSAAEETSEQAAE